MILGRFAHEYAAKLFPLESEREDFLSALEAGKSAFPIYVDMGENSLQSINLPSWLPPWFTTTKPASSPSYRMDLSSVLTVSSTFSLPSTESVLDLCAAPGGKSIASWRTIHPELLVCNEVIGKRTGSLIHNLEECKLAPALVTRHDSTFFAEKTTSAFSLVLVDAPCSGQSLIAKGEEVPGAFHPHTIRHNAGRQKRIVANAAQSVTPGGHLAYMTCAFSVEENEEVIEWLLKRFPEFEAIKVSHLTDFQSKFTTLPCYRLWPQQGLGAGGFSCLLKRSSEGQAYALDKNLLNPLYSA